MPDTPDGDGSSYNFDRKQDRINDTVVNLTDAMLLRQQLAEKRHELVMEEIRELLELQREQRIDIMAPFESSKRSHEQLDKLEPQG